MQRQQWMRNEKEVIKKAHKTKRKVHFVPLVDIRHSRSTSKSGRKVARTISSADISTSTSGRMFERAISSVETILCLMNLYMEIFFLRSITRWLMIDLNDFLNGFRTHVVASTVCATEVYTHLLSHAHCVRLHSAQLHACVHAWLKVA